MIDVVPLGDAAVLVQLEHRIDPKINRHVIAIARALESANIAGVRDIVPAYASVTVIFDPLHVSFEKIKAEILEVHSRSEESGEEHGTTWHIPVCYEAQYALDQRKVSEITGLAWSNIVNLHASQLYRVYMLGFLPGFGYLGALPEALEVTRKSVPRARVPARSVAMAGRQTAIYPYEAPGGWQIIGRTPMPVILADEESPFVLQPGDHVQFMPVDNDRFTQLELAFASGSLDIREFHG